MQFPPNLPDDLKEYITKQTEQNHMTALVMRHEMFRFFRELSPEQTNQMLQFLSLLGDDVATFYRGYLMAINESKNNICAACNRNHDEDAAKALSGELDVEAEEMMAVEIHFQSPNEDED